MVAAKKKLKGIGQQSRKEEGRRNGTGNSGKEERKSKKNGKKEGETVKRND